MLQKARSTTSKSFMREAEYSKIILGDSYEEHYFRNIIDEVVQNRKNPDVIYTGEKALREQLLSCLKQKGEVKTANVWARLITTELNEIEYLLDIIDERLRAEGDIFGAVEVHLADREILSPHIQFVGTNAEKAEIIIAQILVDFRYELSIESALGKKYEEYEKPYEQDKVLPQTMSMDDIFEAQKIHREEIKGISDILDRMDEVQKRLLDELYEEAQGYISEKQDIQDVWRKDSQAIVEDFNKEIDRAIEEFESYLRMS